MIGEDTTGPLYERMKAAGSEPPEEEDTSRVFKNSKSRAFRAQELLKFEINLTCKLTPIAVHLAQEKYPSSLDSSGCGKTV